MARLYFIPIAIVLGSVSIIQCSSLDLDYVDGMKVVHIGQDIKRDAREPFRQIRTVIHDSLASHGRHRRDSATMPTPTKQGKSGLYKENVLHGDNHTVAFLHWSGAKSQVIFIFTANYFTVHLVNGRSIYAESAYIWRSTDYGQTFKQDDKTKFANSNVSVSGIRFCKGNNKKVIVFDKPNRWMYLSQDEGESYTSNKLGFSPHDIQCHSTQDNVMLAYDASYQTLWFTKDSGANWNLLYSNVVKYLWVLSSLGNNPLKVFIEVKNQDQSYHSSMLKYADLSVSSQPKVKVFDTQLGNFDPFSFDMQGNYLFVKKHYPSVGFYVSYNLGPFKKAKFPTKLPSSDYLVVDASEGEVLICTRDRGTYNLYISDSTGSTYSLSLRQVFATRTRHWGQWKTLADVHRVKSLRGVYIANTIVGHHGDVHFRTMITFDKGGSWYPLRVPAEAQGSCTLPRCSLNLHMTLSQHYYQITGIVSSRTAVGLIMAQGQLGIDLSYKTDVYMSSDGGLTWKKVLDGLNDFVFLDHGGIIIAVPLRNNSKSVHFSCNEGKSWKTLTVGTGFRAYGLVTEPGETTLVANIFGQHLQQKFEWLSVKLNFSSILNQQCTDSNYTFWTPTDERIKENCSLGEELLYKRRKADDCCFNGRNYDVYINRTTCNCTLEDFMCDVGFVRDSDDEECYPTDNAAVIPEICPETTTYMKSSGYRRVPGDRCSGGQLEIDLGAVKTKCPTIAPSGLQIVMERTTVASASPVTFKLLQAKGSTKSTWYIWDFGDGNYTTNVTSLENAHNRTHAYKSHGDYNVSVTAGNKFGNAYTKISIKVIDEIRSAHIEPPHAVLVGRPADFNVTLYSSHPLSWKAEHGFVHFVWSFEEHQKPNLTWDSQVQHTFMKAAKYKVTLEAINEISRTYDSAIVTVHDKLRTLRLYFTENLDEINKGTVEWREYFARRVLYEIVRIVEVDQARLEVAVVQGLPTYVDVSIIERDKNTSLTMDDITELIRKAVTRKALEIRLPDGSTAQAVYAEVIAYDDKKPKPTQHPDTQDTRLAIAIGVAAGVVVLFLGGIIFYVYRRYTWLYRRYHRLSMNGGDALNPMNTEADPALGYSADGEGVRYTVPEGEMTEDSDDELIADIRPSGSLQVMEDDANGDEANGEEAPLTANA